MVLEAEAHRESITEAIMQLPASQQSLTPGRLVVVKSQSVCIHPIGLPLVHNFYLFVYSFFIINLFFYSRFLFPPILVLFIQSPGRANCLFNQSEIIFWSTVYIYETCRGSA